MKWHYSCKIQYFKASFVLLASTLALGCMRNGREAGDESTGHSRSSVSVEEEAEHFVAGNTIKTRYELPKGFHRVETEKGSFEEFLQNLPLKPEGYPTHYYDGSEKDKKVATAVIDMDVDSLDLQHWSGTLIRLYAEYLHRTGQYEKIHFKLKNGLDCEYSKWAQGFRITEKRGGLRWHKAIEGIDFSHSAFREYLRTIFRYSDERSLFMDMKDAKKEEFGIGSVIFDSRPPYRAAIVVDMIKMDSTLQYHYGERYAVLLAQGGFPAQEIEIVRGNGDERGLFRENPIEMKFGRIWTTPNKGEMPMSEQGGNLYTGDYKFTNKKIKKF